MDEDEEKGFVALANEFLEKCGIDSKVYKLTDCKDEFFVSVYKGLIGETLEGVITNPVTISESIKNCQCVIDALAQDVLNVDLAHISASGIINGDTVSIRNLLEIFTGLLEYFLECIDGNQDDPDQDDLEDSNILSTEHDVISELLREEFGAPYQHVYTRDKKTIAAQQPAPASNSFQDQRTASSTAESSVFTRTNAHTRAAAQELTRFSTVRGSHYDADTSEVSDSTNELIKLGETSSSVTSSTHRPTNQSAFGSKQPCVLRDNAWSVSRSLAADEADLSNDLTQYTLNTEDAAVPYKHGLDNQSSSLMSSSLSWQQQISPLDSETEGTAKLGTIGLRPKDDGVGITANQDSSEDASSGRSTPLLHHHYHHHYHHPVGSNTEQQNSRTASSTRLDNATQVNTRGYGMGSLKSIPDISDTSQLHHLPGQSSSIGAPNVPLPDYSAARIGLPGQSSSNAIPIVPLPDHFTARTGLPGQSSSIVIPIVPLPDYSAARTGLSGQSSSSARYLPKRDDILRKPNDKGKSLLSTAQAPLNPTVTSTVDTLHSSDNVSGRLVTTGFNDSVFAGLSTTDPRNNYISSHVKSLKHEQHRDHLNYKPQSADSSLVFTGQPTTRKDGDDAVRYRPATRDTGPAALHRPATRDTEPAALHRPATRDTGPAALRGPATRDTGPAPESDIDDSDFDDNDIANHSDSAIDYNRGEVDESDCESVSTHDSIRRRIHERWKSLETGQTSCSASAHRAVTFNEDVQTIPITSRMDRLKRLLEDEACEQQHTTALRHAYDKQLRDIQRQQEQEKSDQKKRRVLQKSPSPSTPKKKAKKTAPAKPRGRLEAIYRPQGRPSRPKKKSQVKSRKRSASASPDMGRRGTVTDFHEAFLPSLFEEFPFLYVSPQTTHAMWQKQARQLSILTKSETEVKSKSQRSVEEAEKRQEHLFKILKKELDYNQRMRDEHEREIHQRAVKTKVNEKRQIAARARRYYDDYQLRMRAKMLKKRTREEQIFKHLFEEGLEIQKQRVRELRQYAKEKREAIEQRQTNEIQSLENYYKDQFSMLAEGMTRERHETKVRQQAQEKVMRQLRREFRSKMEKEVRNVQESLTRDEDSAYFRQLEADKLRRVFQLAMYKSDL